MGRGRAGKDAGTMQARCKCCGVRAGVFLHVRGGDEMITPLVVSQFACLTIVLPNFRTSFLCSLPFWWRFFVVSSHGTFISVVCILERNFIPLWIRGRDCLAPFVEWLLSVCLRSFE